MTNALPPLPPETYEALKADIAAHGVLQPVIEDEYGHVLDGHHRKQIADELGVEFPIVYVTGLSVDEREELGIKLNLHRRQLSAGDRKAVVQRLAKIRGGTRPRGRPKETATSAALPEPTPFDVPAVAAELGVSRRTIERDLFDEPKRERTATDDAQTHIREIIHGVSALKAMGFADTDRAYHKGWWDDLTDMRTALLHMLQDLA